MKKVLSILLTCMMLLPFAFVASAEGEAYAIKYGNYTMKNSGNTYVAGSVGSYEGWYPSLSDFDEDTNYIDETREYIVLEISTKTATSGGHFALDYDETVVQPAYLTKNGCYYAANVDYSAEEEGAPWLKTSTSISEGIDNGSGLALAWTVAGTTTPDEGIIYLQFGFINGKTSADLNADSFVFGVADGLTSKASTALAGNFNDLGDACYAVGSNKVDVVTASNANRTYPGSDKPATPAGPVESWTVADGNASATVVYDAAVSGKAMIAVYDANGTMIGYTAATEAVTDATSVTISTTYTGTAAKAKVFVWNDYTAAVAAKVWTPAN